MAVLWAADYDQAPAPGQAWPFLQQPSPGRITVVAPPAGPQQPEGTTLRVDLRPGDAYDTGGYVAARCEVYGRIPTPTTIPASDWPDPVGSVRWYGWSLFVPVGFPFATDASWLVCTQWKGLHGGSPPIAVEIKRNALRLGGARTNAGLIPGDGALGPITPGTWTRLAVGLRLSAGADGWVQAFRDGHEVLPRTAVATMDLIGGQPDPVYVKQGIYRQNPTLDQTLYFGPLLIGERLRDIT